MEKSCQVIEILFWIGIGIVFYTYLGYGMMVAYYKAYSINIFVIAYLF